MRYLRDCTLQDLMDYPLPAISIQKRLPFRPSYYQTHYIYELINDNIFNNELKKPKIELAARRKKYWGMCVGNSYRTVTGSYCELYLMDKFISIQWFVTILAHEMAHQYQWDIIGPEREREGKDWLMSHGPSFFIHRDTMQEYDIPLKTAHSQRSWYKHQDLFKA